MVKKEVVYSGRVDNYILKYVVEKSPLSKDEIEYAIRKVLKDELPIVKIPIKNGEVIFSAKNSPFIQVKIVAYLK